MSGFFGVYNRDGRPQDTNILDRLAESIWHRGTDGINMWQDGVIAFGHCMLQTTPESHNEKLPFQDNNTELVITSDARIDNREELAKQLGLAERIKSGIPDSQLILAAYNKWGTKCVEYLLGDFAFAIWDIKRKRLFCARDIFGVKPFYYYLSNRVFVFGSEIRQVVEHPSVTLEINEGVIAEYLADFHISKGETYYANIKRLPPGHYLILETHKTRIQNYWKLRPQKRLWYKNENEYVEHFIEIFGDAVRCRMRSDRTVGVYLSGGLDSSSIVGMAHYLDNGKYNSHLETYSISFPGRGCDETKFINNVIKKWNCKHHINKLHEQQEIDWSQHIEKTLEFPDPPNLTMLDPLMEEVVSNDVHIMLHGLGGDELFTGSPFGYLDLLRRRKIKQFVEELKFNRQFGTKKALIKLIANISWPLIPKPIRSSLIFLKTKPKYPPWISKKVVNNIEGRIHAYKENIGSEYANLSDRNIFTILMNPWIANVFELSDRYSSYYNVENRYPFYDRRLVEFALAIPEYERSRRDITKYILRKAGQYLLPQSVTERKDKAEFSITFVEQIRKKEKNQSVRIQEINQKGYISNEKLFLEKFNQFFKTDVDKQYIENLWSLWFTYSINIFLTKNKNDVF